jgi:hypothetical protein
VRDPLHAQRGFIEQPFGEMQAARLQYLSRRGTEVFQEQSVQLALAHSEPPGHSLHVLVVQRPFVDHAQRSRNNGGSSHPNGDSRRTFRAAAQAGTESGLRRGRRRCEVTHVLFFGGAGRTDGTAVDMAGHDGDENMPVEPRVAGLAGFGTSLKVQLHIALAPQARVIMHLAKSAGLDAVSTAWHAGSVSVLPWNHHNAAFISCLGISALRANSLAALCMWGRHRGKNGSKSCALCTAASLGLAFR